MTGIFEALALNYNAIIVFFATAFLGGGAGLVGCFLVLRKQALVSDAVTHATLPGLSIGFLLSLFLDLNGGKFLPLLLLCAGGTAYIGAYIVQYISQNTRLSTDTAIASVMSFFYGTGLMILSIIQNMESGNKAGLNSFLLGTVSGLTISDLILLVCSSCIVAGVAILYFRQLRLLCFDKDYARLIDMDIKKTENILLFLMILIICIGLKTVGLILIIALLITPPITARLWTTCSEVMLALAAAIGMAGTTFGVHFSIIYDLPTGATIVLSVFSIFLLSLVATSIRRSFQHA